MRESYWLLTQEGIECGLDLDGLLTVRDMRMDDLQVVGQNSTSHPYTWTLSARSGCLSSSSGGSAFPTDPHAEVHLPEPGLVRPATQLDDRSYKSFVMCSSPASRAL